MSPTFAARYLAPSFVVLAGLAQAQDTDPADELAAYVTSILPEWEVPGLSIAVVSKGELVLARGYGVTRLGSDEAVDEHTLFSIGSTTKAMTVAVLGSLADEGKLTWDVPVTRHLPEFRLSDPYVTREVTLRDLLTHRAGLGNADGLWYGTDRTRAQILAQVPYIPAAYSLRDGFVYQNIMYLVAGELSAKVAGESWEELMRARLFGPLGMGRSVATTSRAQTQPNVARPHARVDGEVIRIENEVLDAIAPAGGVWSSAAEMSRWMGMLLAEGEWQDKRVLSKETVAEMFKPQTLIGGGPPYPYLHLLAPHWISYGLGWFQLDYQGRAVQFHTGSIDGMSAIVGLVPEEDLGVVVLANLDHAELRHALLWKAIDLFTDGGDGRDWSAELLPIYAARAARATEARARRDAARRTGSAPSLGLGDYAGVYRSELYGYVSVTLEGGALHLTGGPRLNGKLEHWHYDTFLWRRDRRWQGEPLVNFELDAAGAAARLELSGTTFARVPD